MDSPSMTVRDVALYLNVDEKTVYRLAKRGELPGFKVAGTWRFRSSDIQAWIDAQVRATGSEQGLPHPATGRRAKGEIRP